MSKKISFIISPQQYKQYLKTTRQKKLIKKSEEEHKTKGYYEYCGLKIYLAEKIVGEKR